MVNSFAIKGRGLVVSGHITSGTVMVGATVSLPDAKGTHRSRRITAIETGNAPDSQGQIRAITGLVLGQLRLPDLQPARTHLAPGSVLEIADPAPPEGSLFTS